MNILICTLGGTWAVIPEALGLLDPDRVPLYRQHPHRNVLDRLRQQEGLAPVDELWILTTDGAGPEAGLQPLLAWQRTCVPGLRIRIWKTAELADVADEAASNRVRELIFRAVLMASETVNAQAGRLYLSLAGGRKTMSADLQRAGTLMGCQALLHIIAPPPHQLSPTLKEAHPEAFAHPLATEDCAGLMPLVVGRGHRSELLDISTDTHRPLRAEDFPLPLPAPGQPLNWQPEPEAAWLQQALERREQEGSRLLGNFLHQLATEEHHENWRSLYRLPPRAIARLKETFLSEAHLPLLRRLPKADLHRHIGGCLTLDDQRRVGRALWQQLAPREQGDARQRVERLLQTPGDWPWNWPGTLGQGLERAAAAAALLTQATPEQLERNLYGVTEPRHALQQRQPHGFAYYERPGELSGSALLSHPAALEPYIRALMDNAAAEGLSYLELRGSPQKYRPQLEAQLSLLQTLKTIAGEYPHLRLGFIIILDRRQADTWDQVIELAVKARQTLGDFLVGLDLAGDENQDDDASMRRLAAAFEPAFEHCLPISIHAGEGTDAQRIWQAAYRLHADRIGHGLTLREHPALLERFRDRGIAIELCPTSNQEVVGFTAEDYPLAAYWQAGLPLALCTDNPGISRTDSNREYLRAAALCPDGLSLWDTLALMKQGFSAAFAPAKAREDLLKQADRQCFAVVEAWLREG